MSTGRWCERSVVVMPLPSNHLPWLLQVVVTRAVLAKASQIESSLHPSPPADNAFP